MFVGIRPRLQQSLHCLSSRRRSLLMQLNAKGIQAQLLREGDQGLSLTGARAQDAAAVRRSNVAENERGDGFGQGILAALSGRGESGHRMPPMKLRFGRVGSRE
jgi:hypothetical protein